VEIAYVFLILGLVVAVARIGKFHSLMGQVLDLRRLRAAYEAVRSNRGEPGVDGVTVEAFGEQLEANLAALVVELRAKTYRPQPVRRVLIPKPDGGQRVIRRWRCASASCRTAIHSARLSWSSAIQRFTGWSWHTLTPPARGRSAGTARMRTRCHGPFESPCPSSGTAGPRTPCRSLSRSAR